jgi:hypothetical protein
MESVMRKAMRNGMQHDASEAIRFNYNKLQAVACIACSSAVSIGAIYWLIKALS